MAHDEIVIEDASDTDDMSYQGEETDQSGRQQQERMHVTERQ